MSRIGLVTPRFGNDIIGGSEQLAYHIANMLSHDHEVTVMTSTAVDPFTWAPHRNAGVTEINKNLKVYYFNTLGRTASDNPDKPHDQMSMTESDTYIRNLGPQVPNLYEYLKANESNFDKVFFIPYLFSTTYIGMQQIPPHKRILIPAAHDEAFLHMSAYKVYQYAHWMPFYDDEVAMLQRYLGIPPKKDYTILTPEIWAPRHSPLDDYEKALVFVGRACRGKNVHALIQCVHELRRKYPEYSDLKLNLVGFIEPGIRKVAQYQDWIVQHGPLDNAKKTEVIRRSWALVNPSTLDSFGLVNLEAVKSGTPSIVNRECVPFRRAAEMSGHTILTFVPSDPLTLHQALRVVGDPVSRKRHTQRAQAWVCDRFTSGNMKRSLETAINT